VTIRALLVLAPLALSVAGCSAVTCRPSSIVVARKEERARVEDRSGGLYRTTETGRLEPAMQPGAVREYWVQSKSGEWYRVSAEQFAAADVDRPIEICR